MPNLKKPAKKPVNSTNFNLHSNNSKPKWFTANKKLIS